MNVSLSSEIEKFIESQVESGKYLPQGCFIFKNCDALFWRG